MAVGDDRRVELRSTALVGLVRSLDGTEVDRSSVEPVGRTGVGTVRDGVADVYVDGGGVAVLAGALLWADRRGAESLRVILDDPATDPALTARLASRFTTPVSVLERTGATATPVEPAPDPGPVPLLADDDHLRSLLAEAGLEVVEEHGVVTGELRGLEVARLVLWPTGTGGDGAVHLETGVGRFDRDATAAVRPEESPRDALRRVVDAVAPHRVAGASGHPASTLARERWLRSELLDDPSLLGAGADALVPVATTVPRAGVRDAAPAAATGRSERGDALVVVCSVGADLAFVPVAADTRAAVDPSARLVLVVPARDLLPSTRRLAELVRGGAELVGVPAPWDPGATP